MLFWRSPFFIKTLSRNKTCLLLISLLIQIVLALLFGHMYDTRVFMATGYLVATGQNPYIAQDLSLAFNNVSFQGISSFGYLPPWALMLGGIYELVYSTTHSFLLYNLAIKIPIIIANICLAYLVAAILKKGALTQEIIDRVWVFMLFNPLLLYFATSWGQIDSILTLLTLLALVLVYEKKPNVSAVLLSLSLALKPTALPVLPVILMYLWRESPRQSIRYLFLVLLSILVLSLGPFLLFNWHLTPILSNWNFHFSVVGGISPANILETILGSYKLPGLWWVAGLLWIPAFGIGIYLLDINKRGFEDLLRKSLGLIMIFFLTRTWLSEPNIILILPIITILVSIGEFDWRTFVYLWTIPLIFTVFNGSLALLFFPVFPNLMDKILMWTAEYHTVSIIIKSVLTIAWQFVGWTTVAFCYLKRIPRQHNKYFDIILTT